METGTWEWPVAAAERGQEQSRRRARLPCFCRASVLLEWPSVCLWVPRVGCIVLGPVCACRLLPLLGISCQSFTQNHQLHCNWVRSLQRPQPPLPLLHNGKNVILQFRVTLCVCSWTLLTMGLRKDTSGVSPETKQSNRHNAGLRNAAFLWWPKLCAFLPVLLGMSPLLRDSECLLQTGFWRTQLPACQTYPCLCEP